ncbi:MAG: sulfatase [Opitutaceae bacterium]|nr:sulfatase [Opitutaceae bacterium]
MKRSFLLLLAFSLSFSTFQLSGSEPPNILFFFADDWGRYASIYADPKSPSMNDVIQTPNIDRIGREGVVFKNAFVPVASCTPCRSSLATGRYFWNCGSGAFLNPGGSSWTKDNNPFNRLPKFVDGLADSRYHTARSGKTFAFTPTKTSGKERALPVYKDKFPRYGLYVGEATDETERLERHNYVIERARNEIKKALLGTPDGKPFFFVFGPINVHRPYVADSGENLWGINPDDLKGLIPKFLPDVEDVRRDFADYLGEILALDLMLGVMLEELEASGELDNTLVILSGDHGIPGVPRGKTNCYDLAIQAPLLMRWPGHIQPGRTVDDFVNLMDLGPTLLELAEAEIPDGMVGRSFLEQIKSKQSGWIDSTRDHVIVGRERHYHSARAGNLPYPMRAVRNKDYLYIKNFKPDRWPMGDPHNWNTDQKPTYDELHTQTAVTTTDLDASLTKAYMFTHRDDHFELTLGKRPMEELYDIKNDPDQLHNLLALHSSHSDEWAEDPSKASVLKDLRQKIDSVMLATSDPRLTDSFDYLPYSDPTKPRVRVR